MRPTGRHYQWCFRTVSDTGAVHAVTTTHDITAMPETTRPDLEVYTYVEEVRAAGENSSPVLQHL